MSSFAPPVIRSTDRVLELSPMEGKTALSSQMLPDKRLFTGAQKLHVKMNPETTLWSFHWEQPGLLPGGLTGVFTGPKQAIKHASDYFAKRNIQVTRVID